MLGLGIFGGLALVALVVAGIVTAMIFLAGLIPTLMICFFLVSVLMMLVILIQKPKGGGLAGAFGGAGGGGQTAFGAKTGDVLTWVTVGFFVLFLGLAMGLNWTIRPAEGPPTIDIEAERGGMPTTPTIDFGSELPVPPIVTPGTPAAPESNQTAPDAQR